MLISIIISVFESYEIVRRQLLHFEKIDLPFELIIVDDGSRPPIEGATVYTGNNLAWTQGIGRNAGARIAKSDKLLFTDIDHILTKESIEDAINFTGKRMMFRRRIGILDENGNIREDDETLNEWGWKGTRDASVHGNTFTIPREDFLSLGGYEERHSLIGYHPISRGGDDVYFNRMWNKEYRGERVTVGRDILLFPTGRFHKSGDLNPFGFFHNLSQSRQDKFLKYG